MKTNLCHVTRAEWRHQGDRWTFTITADRFLRNMVRAIVGTLFEVGRGRLSEEGFRDVIEALDRSQAGDSAAAEGLALVEVHYPADIYL